MLDVIQHGGRGSAGSAGIAIREIRCEGTLGRSTFSSFKHATRPVRARVCVRACVRVRTRNKKIDDIATAPATRRLPADQ